MSGSNDSPLTEEEILHEVAIRMALGTLQPRTRAVAESPALPEGANPLPRPNNYGVGPWHPFFLKQ